MGRWRGGNWEEHGANSDQSVRMTGTTASNWDRRFIKGGGGVHPDFLGNFNFEIAVDQQTKAHY